MSLREYSRKRRAGQTPEPAADSSGTQRGHRPVFVVQLHHASVRHYDFRLEVDGVLKSWAVPKGPSLRAGEKRLAVEVEDHPLDYAQFQGDIPEGHYGAGHVDVFDQGVWSATQEPLAAIAAGKLDFVLHGQLLGGAWKLIRTAKSASKPQWLLIKRSDSHARDVEADDFAPETPAGWKGHRPSTDPTEAGAKAPRSLKTARKTELRKSRKRATTEAGSVWRQRALSLDKASALQGVTPSVDPQLATLRAAPPKGDDWLHELKWDGYRLLARIDRGKATLRSRNGLDWTADYPDIVSALESLGIDQASLDGELIALDRQGRNSFSALQRTIEGSDTATLRYVVFDLPTLEGVDLRTTDLIERKTLLESLLGTIDDPAVAYSQHIVGHGPEVFTASRTQQMEGIVSKAVDGSYVEGRSRTWVKVKHAQSDEFVVVGFTAPKNSRLGFGSLLLATRDAGRLKYVGRVGSGFDDATLRKLTTELKALQTDSAAVRLPGHVPFSRSAVTWVQPRLVVEVAYRGLAKEGLLRQASFQRIRHDKEVTDVGSNSSGPADEVAISSPDKLIYPDEDITKQDVADYYRRVADRLLPEVARRPLSLLRCPEGLEGQCFFQKHHADTLGDRVLSVPVKGKDGGKDDYLYIEDVEGLLQLVQMNALELHPWGSRIDAIETPDRLVFDLDPGAGVDWTAMKRAARDVRDRLQEIGLTSFLRLTGGKGLHVVVPIAPGPSWTRAKAFCQAFADAMTTKSPGRYVATASKAKRRGVIFIDWLRNGRGATSVASWSLRARPGAGVAVPLRWDELGRTRSGADYPMSRALRRAASLQNEPWDGWEEATAQVLVELGS